MIFNWCNIVLTEDLNRVFTSEREFTRLVDRSVTPSLPPSLPPSVLTELGTFMFKALSDNVAIFFGMVRMTVGNRLTS